MGIHFNGKEKIFHLQAGETSYLMQVTKYGHLAHLYWGPKLRGSSLQHLIRFKDRAFSPVYEQLGREYSLDHLPQEYPAYGNSDLRSPAFQVQLNNGSTVTDLLYADHRIMKGKRGLQGLPATYVEHETEAETLEIKLLDALTGLTVMLSYTAYEVMNVIARSVRFSNDGTQDLKLLRALTMSIDFHDADYDMLHLSGAWARERHVERRPLFAGTQSVESRRGASSHQHNPFVALLGKNADETQGDVYGFNLVYSGNFAATVEVDQYAASRVSIGINPFDFTWLLQPGESFQTPEAVMVYSPEGIGGMSRTYHKLYRTRLCRGEFRDRTRPVLVNNWEATYFDFNADKIESIAKVGQELGIELFVLDDGWFGRRDDDNSSLGDWVVDRNKLPAGLDDLAKRVTGLGMQFGLWFEPEMVSPDSDLYRKHPDWCLHVPDRQRSLGRGQLILDLSRDEVCDAIVQMVSDILASSPISYVKWDMNRHMTEIGSAPLPPERQRETAHRYMLGLYRIMEQITSRFPNVLFESCSGGGGRFDPGILYYMPQTWTSDNTDAVSRLRIQYGTSIVYPISTMGAHVSAVPNHQTHRLTSLDMRGDAAMSGNFGYELDLTKLTADERQTVKRQVSQYKENRELVQLGDFYRLLSPFAGDDASWMFVADDKSEALVFYFGVLTEANIPYKRVKLQGLDPAKVYRMEGTDFSFGGDQLMYVGLNIPELPGDFQSCSWKFRAVGE
jgi:alpha-galactosidase